MAVMDLIKHCLENPKAVAWWVSPTITMAREIGWSEFKEYEEDLAPAIATVHETLLRVRFKNGAVLYFKGADNERSLRGRGLTYLVIDEAAFIEPLIWTRVLSPALADKQGKALLISTPNGRNWFYDTAVVADRSPDWDYFHWPTIMNPLITEDELLRQASMTSELDFRQEFLAEFITKAGMVYDDFNQESIIEAGIPNIHAWEVFLGIDFGYANPTAVCFMAVNELEQQVVMFDEIYVARKKMEEIEYMIMEKLAFHGMTPADVKAIYTDPAGNAAELSSGISPVDYLRMSDRRWKVYNKGSLIAPGLALVRSFIKAASGKRSFLVTNNCVDAIRSLNGYTYESKSNKNETVKEEAAKDGIHDHMCDAIRYFFINRFDQNKWIAEVPEQYNYGEEHKTKHVYMKRCPTCRRQFSSKTPKSAPPYKCTECIANG